VKRDAELGFSFVADLNGGTVLAEVGTFEGDEQGVEVTAHLDFRWEISEEQFEEKRAAMPGNYEI
jgi:hypothetical protein